MRLRITSTLGRASFIALAGWLGACNAASPSPASTDSDTRGALRKITSFRAAEVRAEQLVAFEGRLADPSEGTRLRSELIAIALDRSEAEPMRVSAILLASAHWDIEEKVAWMKAHLLTERGRCALAFLHALLAKPDRAVEPAEVRFRIWFDAFHWPVGALLGVESSEAVLAFGDKVSAFGEWFFGEAPSASCPLLEKYLVEGGDEATRVEIPFLIKRDPRFCEVLFDVYVDSRNPRLVRKRALEGTLSPFGNDPYPRLIGILEKEDDVLILATALVGLTSYACTEVRKKEAERTVLALLQRIDKAQVVERALACLAIWDTPSSVSKLIELANQSGSTSVRQAALLALGRCSNTCRTVSSRVRLLLQTIASDEPVERRFAAAHSLSQMTHLIARDDYEAIAKAMNDLLPSLDVGRAAVLRIIGEHFVR